MSLVLNHTWMSHGVDGELDILIFDIIFSLIIRFYLAVVFYFKIKIHKCLY